MSLVTLPNEVIALIFNQLMRSSREFGRTSPSTVLASAVDLYRQFCLVCRKFLAVARASGLIAAKVDYTAINGAERVRAALAGKSYAHVDVDCSQTTPRDRIFADVPACMVSCSLLLDSIYKRDISIAVPPHNKLVELHLNGGNASTLLQHLADNCPKLKTFSD